MSNSEAFCRIVRIKPAESNLSLITGVNCLADQGCNTRHYVTCGKRCYKLTTESAKEEEELQLDQEEADTRLLLHARHATKEPFNAIVISSEDTDVRILCLAFSNDVKVPLFHRCVSQQMARYIDIGKIASAIGLQVCKALLGLHAFTGCDSVSSFAGIGKVKPLKILRKNDEFQEVFGRLGEEWSLTEELFGKLEAFVCALYGAKKGTSDVNELRYALFCACNQCLIQISTRASR